ncbi:unnamed protein product [Phytophthora lilii]|uniref:Unnamed protein product n=1 Tax=Phytophthora lilii TaxID=2077276 RepID=A0A9W7CLE3_9STRA|nr:unnamed protein product [Phytophthora lilii]
MYKELKVSSSIPAKRLLKAANGGSLQLTKADLAGSDAVLHLHPESYAKVMKAKKAGKGSRIIITPNEIRYPMEANGGSMQAGSIWKKIWSSIKAAWKPVIKPALSAAADGLASMGSAYVASTGRDPALVGVARQALKKFTGVGVAGAKPSRRGSAAKGSPEMKAKMARLRAMRKTGGSSKRAGSFRLN